MAVAVFEGSRNSAVVVLIGRCCRTLINRSSRLYAFIHILEDRAISCTLGIIRSDYDPRNDGSILA